jgi:hypothetical protein
VRKHLEHLTKTSPSRAAAGVGRGRAPISSLPHSPNAPHYPIPLAILNAKTYIFRYFNGQSRLLRVFPILETIIRFVSLENSQIYR